MGLQLDTTLPWCTCQVRLLDALPAQGKLRSLDLSLEARLTDPSVIAAAVRFKPGFKP